MGEKIKVLHIIKSLGRGGAEMLLPETLKLHDQSRFEFHYIYFLPWKNQMVEAIERNGGVVKCFSSSNNIQITSKYRSIVRYIRKQKIQLIHCHLPWAGILGRFIHRGTGIPVIYTEHNKQERYHFLTRWMNKFTFNWQSQVVAVSQDVAESIRKNIAPKISVSIILNGVNTDHFVRDEELGRGIKTQLGIPENSIVLGTIAVFRFQKRLKEWIDIFSLASKKQPNLMGIIVGDGPLKREIIEHIEMHGLQKKIIMPGLQTDVKPWLSAMDIFMMSSMFEGLPIALLEAMSMECAIATTNAGGVREVIQHGQDGLMVDVENWGELPTLISQMIENPAMRKSMGMAARQTVIKKFGMDRMVKELEALYARTMSST
jgi:L-malate glycosyltransferase